MEKQIKKYFSVKTKDILLRMSGKLGDKELSIEVIWGDWKHAHMYLDLIMADIGYKLIDNEITEDNGSDNYSGLHHYRKDTPQFEKRLKKLKAEKKKRKNEIYFNDIELNREINDLEILKKSIIK